jgi:hypothetical protein
MIFCYVFYSFFEWKNSSRWVGFVGMIVVIPYVRSTGPLGTLEKPKEVPSYYNERIVGVVDPDDDSHLIWSTVKAGEAPKQIIEGGEYFVLKKLEGGPSH